MNIRIKIFMLSLSAACIVVSIVSYFRLFSYRSSVNESALSLCANVFVDDISSAEKAKYFSFFLSFSDVPQTEREKLISAVKHDTDGISDIIGMLEYFKYGRKSIEMLCDAINRLEPAEDAFSITQNMSSEELVEIMIRVKSKLV